MSSTKVYVGKSRQNSTLEEASNHTSAMIHDCTVSSLVIGFWDIIWKTDKQRWKQHPATTEDVGSNHCLEIIVYLRRVSV